ncbi:hypothetical protein BGZ98_005621 [Dissophora globulifera]|nr:hypothetical protein BGZ98_005621 [Dissophora globulifera]
MERFLASIPKEARLQRSTFFSLSSWHSSHHRTDPHSLATLDGHAVVDEEDDDVGNELLDTEEEGLFRPDDDETIEGEILEEEEDDDVGGEQEAEDTEEEVVGNKSRFTLKIQLSKVHIFKSGWQRENSHDGVVAPEKLNEVRA